MADVQDIIFVSDVTQVSIGDGLTIDDTFGNNLDETDYFDVSNKSKVLSFSSGQAISVEGTSSAADIENFSGITTTIGNQEINLGVNFTSGVANPEINKTTGDVIYIDNRKLVTRDSRQKEDIKIILEF